jgi:hypothetical protein
MPPYAFWYVYTSNGTDGFLLDLIRRPEQAAARLAVYHEGTPPRIFRRGFALDDLQGTPGELGVRLGGDFALDAQGCRGVFDDVSLNAEFELNGRQMRFVPQWVSSLWDEIPDYRSHYGRLTKGACAGAEYSDSPLVYSTYSLEDLSKAQWVLISAPRFADTDFAFEISAAHLLGRWLPTAWVFHEGREHHLDSGLDSLFHVKIGRGGEVEGGERVFTASIERHDLRIEIDARGPVDQFARLEQEGKTEIHTTLFGSCRATVNGKRFTAERTCLLELKR